MTHDTTSSGSSSVFGGDDANDGGLELDLADVQVPIHHGLHDGACVPRGFSFAGLRCGIKQSRSDLGLIVSQTPAVAAGCFTRNKVRAACVDRNAALLPADRVRAIVVNSGNANAMTGPEGDRANERMAACVATALQVDPAQVLTASTGMIGIPLPVDLVEESAGALVDAAGDDPVTFAQAIVTTDTTIKVAHAEVILPGDTTPVRVLGAAKGSGMIHPNMATTLGFVCTDAAVAPALLQRLVRAAVEQTFNAISVDGDTSTNDMVVVLAGGKSGHQVEGDGRTRAFAAALVGVLRELAKMVAGDGEGATRLLEVEIKGAPSPAAARALARGVCSSSLVKCSTFAGQPEWGRVAMAVGQTAAELGLDLQPDKMLIEAQGVTLYDGAPSPMAKGAEVRRALRGTQVHWSIDVGLGQARGVAYGCDLGYDYVRINADEAKQIEVSRAGGISRNLTLAAYSPRLKQQLLCEGLSYVRRFMGLRAMIYLQPSARAAGPVESLACDLELCLDAGLKPLAVVPDESAAAIVEEHMQRTGHYATLVPPDPVTITQALDRGHLCILVREAPAPDAIVDLCLKLGIQKLIALGNDQGLRDGQGVVQRLSPDTLLAGIDRHRFDSTDPDLLVLARHAANRGVPALHIVDARVPHAVVGELFTDEGVGTLITRQAMA